MLTKENTKAIYPLSPMQEGMFFHYLADEGSNAYFEQLSYTIKGHINIDLIDKAINEIIDRYDLLRTVFTDKTKNKLHQIVLKKRYLKILFRDIANTHNKEEIINSIKKEDIEKGFDLTKDILMRITVLKTCADEYEFIWSHHHIIMDGWCIGIIVNEFQYLYNCHLQGITPKLPTVKQYGEYISWIEKRDKEQSRFYWDSYLKGYSTLATLPKKATKSDQSIIYSLASESSVIGCNKMQQLHGICKDFNVTLNTIIQVAWGILLSKYNNTNDVVFGSVVSGRPSEIVGIETMVGLFINTLPVRINYTKRMSVGEIIKEVQEKAIEREHNQYIHLSDIQSISELKRELFDHIFVFENYPIADKLEAAKNNNEVGNNFRVTNVNVFEQSNYDLSLILNPREEIKLNIKYNANIYDKNTIRRISVHFNHIFEQIILNSSILVSNIEITSESEKHQLLYEFNNTKLDYPNNTTINELFEKQVEMTPNNIALVLGEKEMTFLELNEKSNQLASHLITNGVKADDIVGILVDRSFEMIIGILGILKSGGAYLPIDPSYPEERVKYLMYNSGTKLILSHPDYQSRITEVKTIDLANKDNYKGKTCNVGKLNNYNSLVYLIYTSGSTGKPKGVMIEHHSLVNFIYNQINEFGINGEEKILQLTTYSFDASIEQIFLALLSGASLILINKDFLLDDSLLNQYISDKKVTHVHAVPALLDSILTNNKTIKRLIAGGDICPVNLAKKWYKKCDFYNKYGPTETTISSTEYLVKEIEVGQSSLPIGKPIQNTNIYILNSELSELQPIGVPGELCIGGVGLARGYWQNEELTKEKFVANPFKEGEHIYKTGDLAKWLPNGNIEYLGRIDHQVKIRGFRIELGEIETALTEYEKINDAIVIAKGNEGQKYLCAYIVSDEEINVSELRIYLSQSLPDYMLPAHFIRLESIPLTPNGKIDRKALSKSEVLISDEYVAPKTKEQKLLVEIWSKVLRFEKIGITDNFFSLGGDSIKSIQICSRMRSLGYKISVKDIFTTQTILDLSLRLKKIESISEQSLITGISSLTPIQLKFFKGAIVNKHHYNQSVMLYFSKGISKEVVTTIFCKLQDHHDALRIVFKKEGDKIFQHNMGADFPVSIEEYNLKKESDPASTLLSISREIQSGINIEKGPLMKLGLFHMCDGSRLLIVIHHLVIDGVSWRILFEDIETLYQQLKNNNKLSLPLKTDSFLSWAGHLFEYTKSKRYQRNEKYWDNLTSEEFIPIKRDYSGGRNTRKDNVTESIKLNINETSKLLTEVHSPFGTQINDILLVALILSIKKQYGNQTLLIDLEGHGREEIIPGVNINRTVGWFTSIYPVLLKISEESLSGTIRQVKESLRQVPNNGIDYLIRKYFCSTDGQKDTKYESCALICFNFLGQFDVNTNGNTYRIAQEARGEEISPNETGDYDWNILGLIAGGQLEMSLRYSKFQYEREKISSFMGSYKECLVEVINYCCTYEKKELSPSDLTYKKLSIPQLDKIQQSHEVEDIYPLSPMQEGMLFHSLLDTEADHYFEQITYHLKGKIDLTAIEQSIEDLVSRYGILRTVFITNVYERPLQVVLKKGKINFTYKDIQEEFRSNIKEEVIQLYQRSDKAIKFDLSRGPLLRLTVLQTNGNEFEFIWSHHHIITDGWCISIIINEFNNLYIKNKNGAKITLPKVQPYSRYIEWLEDKDKEESEIYWKKYLEGYENLSCLPRKSNISIEILPYKNEFQHLIISRDQTQLLHKISRNYGVTINTILQCAWGIILAKYNNVNDVVFGSVVSGRTSEIEGIETIIGLFINTIPIRIGYSENQTTGSFLQEVQKNALESEPHHYSPLSEIQKHCELGRELLDHLLVFENYPVVDKIESAEQGFDEDNEYTVTNVQVFEQTSYNLTLIIIPGEVLTIKFSYNANIYDKNIIEGIIVHLGHIVEQMISNREMFVSDIEIITEKEKGQILYEFNDTKANYPKEKSITELFEEQVAKYPENKAVIYEDIHLSYNTLNEKANQVANFLLQHFAIKPDSFIGLMIDRNEWMLIGILGILKTGAAYLPIDTSYPQSRIDLMLKDCDIEVVITTIEYQDRIKNFKAIILDESEIQLQPTINIKSISKSHNLTYVIFTSGSMGIPKGTLISNYSITRVVRNTNYINILPDDKILQLSNYAFDGSVFDIFGALLNGATLILISKDNLLNVDKLADTIEKEKITVFFVTTALFNTLVDFRVESLINVRKILFGGEQVSLKHTRKAFDYLGVGKLIHVYGPTESCVFSTYYQIDSIDVNANTIPIGKPISNTKVFVLDRFKKLLPIGVSGELCISGDGLSAGYQKRDDLTKDRFIENPFQKGEKLYCSGDLVKWLPDGNIEFLGRIDHQVKVRGFRIELGEIETALVKNEKIKEAIVIARGEEGEKYLCAYIVSEEDIVISEMREYLSQSLPEYMLPSHFVRLERMPLTPNGKVDRKALPVAKFILEDEYVAPKTKEEKLLAEVWSKVLGIQNIGVTDNFFSVGGDSIKSIQISSRVRATGYEISVKDIFTSQTIQGLSQRLKKITTISNQSLVIGNSILTPIQQRFFDGIIKNRHHFNQSVMLNFKEGISGEIARTIFSKLYEHHDALRMVFKKEGSKIVQYNMDAGFPVSLEEYDLKKEADPSAVLLKKSKKIQSSINIESGPLMKLGLFHMNEGSRLLIVIHHLVIDGVSWRILFEDIETLYQQLKNNKPFSLPLKTDSFLSWSGHLFEYIKSNRYKKAEKYWNTLINKEIAHILRDNPEGSNTIENIRTESMRLSKVETSKLLTEVHAPFGTQINDILLVALLLSIKKQYRNHTVMIDLEGHGREEIFPDVNISRTVGWFTSIYPVLLEIKETDNLSEKIKQVKETLRCVPNNGVDYLLKKYYGSINAPDVIKYESCAQICFNYLGQFDSETKDNSYRIAQEAKGEEVSLNETREYDWEISGMIISEQLIINHRYSRNQYESGKINSLMGSYKESLVEVINHCCNCKKKELTPSDLTYKKLSIKQLNELQQYYEVEDIYPLSPMQEGMLFYSLLDSETEHYFDQATYQLSGNINIKAVEQSMNDLIQRYGILRTVFLPNIYERPFQLVLKERKSDFLFVDVRKECLNSTKEEVLKSYQIKDKSNKFNLSKDCLMRLTILQIDNTEYDFIWSHHHILMDGWCLSIIINEFNSLYIKNNYGREINLPPVQPYSHYIEWIENINKKESVKFWKMHLNNYKRLVSLPKKEKSLLENLPYRYQTKPLLLNSEKINLINIISREFGVTFNTIIQCAWAILLANYNDVDDVVFGSVVSGRPAEIEGIETMIGLFINAIPVRIRINKEDSIGTLLKMVQNKALESEPFHYSPLAEIQASCKLGSGLLDHIVVVENYPLVDRIENRNHENNNEEGFSVTNFQFAGQSNYDLVLLVSFGKDTEIRLDYNANVYEEEIIKNALLHLNSIIDQITENNKLIINEISLSHNLILADSNISEDGESDFRF